MMGAEQCGVQEYYRWKKGELSIFVGFRKDRKSTQRVNGRSIDRLSVFKGNVIGLLTDAIAARS